jgi:DNA-binding PadR family transcriptional regulator
LKRTYLTDFELMLLLAVLRVGDQAYGAPIAREIETLGERAVMLGAVYAGLDRLEANGLVASSIGDPTPERGGRAKRYFRVTPTGMKAVRQTRRALTNLWAGVPGLDGGRA